MKLQRFPVILLAIALLLGGFVYLYEVQGTAHRADTQTKTEQLFTFKEEEVQALNLTTPTQKLAFAKVPAARVAASQQEPQKGELVWAMTAPEKAPASDASIAYLLNLLATGQRQQTITVPDANQAESFGLRKPTIVEVKLSNQQTHRLILGRANFNSSAVYAQVDPPVPPGSPLSIVLVSTDFTNAVTRPLAEWKDSKLKTDAPQKQSNPGVKSGIKSDK